MSTEEQHPYEGSPQPQKGQDYGKPGGGEPGPEKPGYQGHPAEKPHQPGQPQQQYQAEKPQGSYEGKQPPEGQGYGKPGGGEPDPQEPKPQGYQGEKPYQPTEPGGKHPTKKPKEGWDECEEPDEDFCKEVECECDKPPDPCCPEDPECVCGCKPWPCITQDEAGQGKRIRRILDELADLVRQANEGGNPSEVEAAKQLEKDLSDLEKQFLGINDLVEKYKKAAEELACSQKTAENQKRNFKNWTKDQPSPAVKHEIDRIWYCDYLKEEERLYCCWLRRRNEFAKTQTCLEQSKLIESEAADDYAGIEKYADEVKKRFDQLKALHDEAKAAFDAQRFNAVYACCKEFCRIWRDIFQALRWDERYQECGLLDQKYMQAPCKGEGCEEPKGLPTYCWFRCELMQRLRALIEAKYQRYKWHLDALLREARRTQTKDALDSFRDSRKEKFVQEAEEV